MLNNMEKMFLAIWLFLGSLFGVNHPSPAQQPLQPTATPTVLPIFMPTPTLAPGQKAIYTFYIQASPRQTIDTGLSLSPSDAGKVIHVNTGALLIIGFGLRNFHVSTSSQQNIFTNPPGIL